VIRERIPPGRGEVRHYHPRARQCFFVLSGQITCVTVPLMASAVKIAVDTYIRAASERDAQARAALLDACFAEDGRMVTRSRELRGRAALAEMFTRFLADPDVLGVRLLSAVDAQGTTFRFRSAVERRDGTLLEAFDAGEIDDNGQISLILTFAGPLADAPDRSLP